MKPKKYEFKLLEINLNSNRLNELTSKAQDEGWELCGNVNTQYFGSPNFATYMYIPFKRLIKN